MGRFLFAAAACATLACGSGLTAVDSALVAAETAQQEQCVDRYAPDAGAQNACRASVRASWDSYWSSLDGGAK